MPTWYEARVCERGYLAARRRGHDGGEPQTWDADVAEIDSGGYLFYDSTRPLPASKFRTDITVIGVPLTEISNSAYTSRASASCSRTSSTWAPSVLLDVEAEVFEKRFAEQYKGKEMLLESNVRALPLGATTSHASAGARHPSASGRPGRARASSSTATPRRRWAACTAAPRLRLVPDHALDLGGEAFQKYATSSASTRHRPQQLRHRAGRGRTGLHRHGGRRRLERRRAFTATSGPAFR